MLGTVSRQLGQTDEAMTEFRRTLEHQPDSAEAWIAIGQILQRRKDSKGASAAFAEAERLRKSKADAQAATFAVSTGMQKLEDGDVSAAVAQLREAVRLAPENAQAHYQLALALRQQGDTASADAHLAEARRLAPSMVPADAK
jgi:Flp pilus assembly protein TadD